MKRLALSTILLVAGSVLATGCVYKMNIQQGNYLVADSVSQLKEGMTRSQVRFLLGTPMVPDAFDNSRWDYYYFFSSRQYKQPLKTAASLWAQQHGEDRPLAVRLVSPDIVHERSIVVDGKKVWEPGASFRGLGGSSLTTVLLVPPGLTARMIALYEDAWNSGTPLN